MLEPTVAANIRAIFIHQGEPVPVDQAALLLGWDLPTIDEAIKWKAIRLDDSSPDAPRITRRELLEHAFEQWSLAEIGEALGPADADRVLGKKSERDPKLVIRDRDTARAAVLRTLESSGSALLLPRAREAARRRVAKAQTISANDAPPRKSRPRRADGIREVTLTATEISYQNLVPLLRLRGRWLARLGFKPGMRVYIATAPGELVMTVTDPAAAAETSNAPRPQLVAVPPLAAPQPSPRVARRA